MSGAYVVPQSSGKERFEFRLPGEKKNRSLPYMSDISAVYRHRLTQISRALSKAETEDERTDAGIEAEDLQFEMLENYCPGITSKVTGEQLDAIITAWAEASDSPSVGE